MRVHLVQLDIRWEDREANHQRVRTLIEGVEVRRGDLVVLPELFDAGFSLNVETIADDDGATLGFLGGLARDLGCVVLGGRCVRGEGGSRATNRMPALGPDGALLGPEYAKVHPFSFGREPEAYRGGERVVVYPRSGALALSLCPAVCYDLRFPELFRAGMRDGAELFALGANWPEARQAHWRALLIARAIENQAFVAGVNRAGDDPFLSYAGGSIVVGPTGEVLGEAGAGETVLSVEIDPGAVGRSRAVFGAWRDHRLLGDAQVLRVVVGEGASSPPTKSPGGG